MFAQMTTHSMSSLLTRLLSNREALNTALAGLLLVAGYVQQGAGLGSR